MENCIFFFLFSPLGRSSPRLCTCQSSALSLNCTLAVFLLILTEITARSLPALGEPTVRGPHGPLGVGAGRGGPKPGTALCPVRAAFRAAPARTMGSLFGRAALRALLCGPRIPGLLVRPRSGESCTRGKLGRWLPRGLCLRTCGS